MEEEVYDYIFDTALAIHKVSKGGPEEPSATLLVTALLKTIGIENTLNDTTIEWWRKFAESYRKMLQTQGFVIIDGSVVDDIPEPRRPSQGFL